ncbi:MAG: ATP-binding protein, partial [Bacteroidota bacterium]
EITFIKNLALFVSVACTLCGFLWSLKYYSVFGLNIVPAIPLIFVVIVGPSIIIAHLLRRYKILIYAQIICIMAVPTLIQWCIGSIDQSGLVIAWSFLGPLGAIMFLDRSKATILMVIWLILLFISILVEPNLFGYAYDLPKPTKGVFYMTNLFASFGVIFLTLFFFHREKERGLALLLKNRELERTNYEQELLLRQNEKLATLGRLSAGIAHELNNPAAAVQRGAIRLQKAVPSLSEAQYKMGFINFSDEEQTIANQFISTFTNPTGNDQDLDALELSDREYEMESVLSKLGFENAWEIAPELVGMGIQKKDLESIQQKFGLEKLKVIFSVLHNLHLANNLMDEIAQGSARISEIVKALKSYTYMDQAPRQFINVNEGLNNTLVMLRSKLKHGIIVHKNFQENLPQVNGFGSELNQVWTNLIDNAVDAMDGKGELWIKTWSTADQVNVTVTDNGKGMSAEIQKHIFDPFFTTKEQGKGTGLGLHISYNIIANKHNGHIFVHSEPGKTRFQVELPIHERTTDD